VSANATPVTNSHSHYGHAFEAPQQSGDFRQGIRLLARLARVAEQTCQSTGISLPQYRLLVSASEGPQRASELAASVGVSRPTLTSLVDGLEQAGLVKRVPVATDRRGIQLELTQAGKDATFRAERALSTRLLTLINGEANNVVPLVHGVVTGIGAALDREGREAR
jgi:DNA-binding MarR family transcriptional regulator